MDAIRESRVRISFSQTANGGKPPETQPAERENAYNRSNAEKDLLDNLHVARPAG
jgi:hypothetical protein